MFESEYGSVRYLDKCQMLAFPFGSEKWKHSAPYDGKLNVGCLLSRSELNTAPEDGKINVGC